MQKNTTRAYFYHLKGGRLLKSSKISVHLAMYATYQ